MIKKGVFFSWSGSGRSRLIEEFLLVEFPCLFASGDLHVKLCLQGRVLTKGWDVDDRLRLNPRLHSIYRQSYWGGLGSAMVASALRVVVDSQSR